MEKIYMHLKYYWTNDMNEFEGMNEQILRLERTKRTYWTNDIKFGQFFVCVYLFGILCVLQ